MLRSTGGMLKIGLLVLAVTFLCLTPAFIIAHVRIFSNAGPITPVTSLGVDAKLLSPVVDTNNEVVLNSHGNAEFTYLVQNNHTEAITGLKLSKTCSCQTNGRLPDTIEPGDTALIRFSIAGPRAGRVDKGFFWDFRGARLN